MFGYSWLRTGQDSELVGDLLETCRAFDINVEGLHTETGPGVYEAAIAAGSALEVADQAALFKTLVKEVAHRHGLSVTFMAKWSSTLPGSSGHVHLSLNQGGKNVFYDARAEHGMSKTMRHFLAGQMALMRELTAMISPTINSYKRYVPGLWAPLVASWGVENRTCALRVIGTSDPKSIHIEHRQGAADLNPYLAISAALAAGLWGIEKKLEPGKPTVGDAGGDGPDALPRTLREATELFVASRAARTLFGDAFVDHYAMTRRWEVSEYDKAVTDWELRRYFESI
jgi:glutamine synthetase